MFKLPKALLPAASLLVVALAVGVLAILATATFGPRTADADPHAGQSVDVAVVDSVVVTNGGVFPTTTGNLSAFNFTNLAVGDVSAANLAAFDTVVLNVASPGLGCNVGNLSASQRSDLVDFVGAGNKLIIYDSECTFGGSVDYSWLPFPFSTNNPGAAGAQGTLNIVEENTLSTSAAGTHFIDAGMLGSQTDAVGDMNVMVTLDPNWCLDMSGTNVNQVTGPVHAYARYGTVGSVGLIIYNGLDVDYLFPTLVPDSATPAGNLAKMWLQELQQPFNPDNLPCAVPVAGISLTPETATNEVGTDHTVTATITDLLGDPVEGVEVMFEVTDGPNTAATGTCSANADCTTDAAGQVSFTYTSDGSTGTDDIEGCMAVEPDLVDEVPTLQRQLELACDTATKEWVEPEPTPTPAPEPTPAPTPTPTPVVAEEVEEPEALPESGGEPPDTGSSGLAWLVAIAGTIAVMGAGSFWFAYQRRRAR
jgi:hypothetical protein